MSKQYYVREGRRFVKTDVPSVVDHRGDYYNKDGSFSKDCTPYSIGLCVIQTPTEYVICDLLCENIDYDTVRSYLKYNTELRLGTISEVYVCITQYSVQLNVQEGRDYRTNANGGLSYLHVSNDPSCTYSAFSSRYNAIDTLFFKTISIYDE